MNREKVYTAPSAEMLLIVPAEELAGNGTWGCRGWHKNEIFKTEGDNPASGLGVFQGNYWAEDGYTLNNSQ